MNQEYMCLSDKEVIVTNEKGNIQIRLNNSELEQELLLENRLETAKNKKEEVKDSINLKMSIKEFIITIIKSRPMTILGYVAVGTLYGGFSVLLDGIPAINILPYTLGGALVGTSISIPIVIGCGIYSIVLSKKIKALDSELEAAKALEKECEKDLNELKSQIIYEEKTEIRVEKPISLLKRNDIIKERIELEMDEMVGKSLTLKRKKR